MSHSRGNGPPQAPGPGHTQAVHLAEIRPLALKGSRGHGQQRSEQETEPGFPGGLASSFLDGETGM